ncbi:MAG: hypothetical protein Q4E55_07725 [Bacteroidales bacterium]|nr:hypothetical protein [Bacteroidales bacterium]
MKTIIIVGTGKAGYLHWNSYRKMKPVPTLYTVDTRDTPRNPHITPEPGHFHHTIADTMAAGRLSPDDVVVDICTPCSCFLTVIADSYALGIRRIIVEKPFVTDESFFRTYPDLDIFMIHNYAFSKITQHVAAFYQHNRLKAKNIRVVFDKNRILDSRAGRGGSDGVLVPNMEVEIPHSIYMVQHILGRNLPIRLMRLVERPMVAEELVIPRHGYCSITSMIGNTEVVYESNFMSPEIHKFIEIQCDDNWLIKGQWATYSPDLQLLTKACVSVWHCGEEVKYETFDVDDNFLTCLQTALRHFELDHSAEWHSECEAYQELILAFSREMKLYLDAGEKQQ